MSQSPTQELASNGGEYDAFKQYSSMRTTQITIHHGDAFNLCYWIQHQTVTPSAMPACAFVYLSFWTAKTFKAANGAKLISAYGVIDTSDLSDSAAVWCKGEHQNAFDVEIKVRGPGRLWPIRKACDPQEAFDRMSLGVDKLPKV
jgi:hypothetical protein